MKLKPLNGHPNQYLFTRDGKPTIWLSRFKKDFGRKQMSLNTENTIEARKKRDEIFAAWLGERPKVSSKVTLLSGDLWKNYMLTKSRKSKATLDSINYSGQHLLQLIKDMYPKDITETWWESIYIPAKRDDPHKGRKFFNDHKWLNGFLSFLHREGEINRLPRLLNPDPPRAEGLYLDDDEIAALYKHGNADLSLQIDLGFKHFMRRSEVLLLPWREIDFKKGVINLPRERTKIRKARSIPLNEAVISTLKARRETLGTDWVFASPRNKSVSIGRLGNATVWRAAMSRAYEAGDAINPEATFHDLRHSGLTRAFAATNRYAEICVVAGLSLAEAQRTYLHMKPEHTSFVSSLVTTKKAPNGINDKL